MEERFEQVEQRVDQHGELIAELRAATLANSQRMGELQQVVATNTQNLDRLTGISERFITVTVDAITRLDQAIQEIRTSNGELRVSNEELRASNEELRASNEELRASNRRQETINDYLIRRDQERDNGS